MIKRILINILILLFLSTVSFATDYYIDPDWGGPYNGTQSEPYNDFTDDYTPACGDTVYLKKGTTLRDSIYINGLTCTEGNKLVLTTKDGFGTGDNPIVTSRHRNSSSWTNMGGGVYRSPSIGITAVGFWVGISGTDDWGLEVYQDTTGDTTPPAGYWDAVNPYIYYYPTGGQAVPGDAGFYFDWSASESGTGLSGIYINSCQWIEVHNINSKKSRYHGIVIAASDNIYVYDSNFDYNGISRLYIKDAYSSLGNGTEVQSSLGLIEFYDCTANYNYDNGLGQETSWDTPNGVVNFYRCQGNYNGASGGYNKNDDTTPNNSLVINYYQCEFAYNGNDNLENKPSHYSYSGVKFYEESSGSVVNCLIHDNLGAGIDLRNNAQSSYTMLIQGNVIYNNGLGDTQGWPSPVGDRGNYEHGAIAISDNYDGGTIRIYNNTIVDNKMNGIYKYGTGNVSGVYLYNNIVIDSGDYNIEWEGNPSGYFLSDHNSWDDPPALRANSTNYSISSWNSAGYVGTDYSQDPLFNDAGSRDYTLAYNSPCIDAGLSTLGASYKTALMPTSSWTDSVEIGDQGTYGSSWEIGAFIFGYSIYNEYPTALQPCDGTSSTDAIGWTSDDAADCKYSTLTEGDDDCDTTYANLNNALATHTYTFNSTVNCGSSETYYIKCERDSDDVISNCLEIIHQVASAGGVSPQPAPVNLRLIGGNVSIGAP